jgi:hypothetical protein
LPPATLLAIKRGAITIVLSSASARKAAATTERE